MRYLRSAGPPILAFFVALTSFAGAAPDEIADPNAPPPAVEAEPPRFRNTLSTNPIRYAILHFQIEYERVVADRWSVFAAPLAFHHAHWYPFARADHMTANGFGLDLGF